jgi:hypothetical protein
MRNNGIARTALAAALLLGPSAADAAGTAAAAPNIGVELNDLQSGGNGDGCRAVFVVTNDLGKPIDKFGVRVVAFDKDQHASLFLTLDIGAMPAGKTRVLRFDLGSSVACHDISRLVLDDVTACDGEGLDPAACLAALAVTSRASAPFTP